MSAADVPVSDASIDEGVDEGAKVRDAASARLKDNVGRLSPIIASTLDLDIEYAIVLLSYGDEVSICSSNLPPRFIPALLRSEAARIERDAATARAPTTPEVP